MITTDMREYEYYLYAQDNEYGQQTLIKDENGNPITQGTVKLAIYTTSQSIQDNINYKNAQYLGLTYDIRVHDNYVIQYGDEMLKVLYVNSKGRYKQLFMANI